MEYKDKKKKNNDSFDKLKEALKAGEIGKCYVFHGEEQYLLMHSLNKLRKLLCPDGLDSFNYKKFDRASFDIDKFEEAIEAMPLFAERTLIEIHEHEYYKKPEEEREQMLSILSDLPEYVCVVFVYSTIEYKPDNRMKTNKGLVEYIQVVEFNIQQEDQLIKWIIKHFQNAGKIIASPDARYLADITGGLMNTLQGEIEKLTAYAQKQQIQRSDIDAVVIPIPDIQVYNLTTAITRREKRQALHILDTLLQMRESPHSLIYSISLKMRQLLAAKICIDRGISKSVFMQICDINREYPATILYGAAKKTSLSFCKKAVMMCTRSAKELNSIPEPEMRIIELVLKLSCAQA